MILYKKKKINKEYIFFNKVYLLLFFLTLILKIIYNNKEFVLKLIY